MSYSLQQKRKSRKPNFENLLSVVCYQPIAIGVSYFGPPTSLKAESQKLKAESQKQKVKSRKSKAKSRKSKAESQKQKAESRKQKVKS
jgi:hypothetical protein